MNRMRAIERLTQAGVPASVLVAPIIPFITDEWMERVMEQAKQAGALTAGYTIVRLPWEVNPIFQSWLQAHFPDRAQRVMERIRDMRDGRHNSAVFSQRMKGTGIYAELIKRRFEVARARLRYLRRNQIELVSQHFVPPAAQTTPAQALLFD
jgi:DNA repair photolyase